MNKSVEPVYRTEESRDPAEKVFVVSFPKSGRTWLRVLLSRYKQQLLGIEDFQLKLHAIYSEGPVVTPQYIFHHARASYHKEETGALIRTLDAPGWLPLRPQYPFSLEYCHGSKVVFMLRDPRDVLVSYYHQLSKREQRAKVLSIDNFARRRLLGIHRIVAYMNFIAAQQSQFEHCHIYYEDLHQDTAGQLSAILSFAGIPVQPDLAAESVAYARFENMRKMELSGSQGNKLQPTDKQDIDSFKTRKGKVGSYREELSPRTVDFINSVIARELDPFFERYRQPREG